MRVEDGQARKRRSNQGNTGKAEMPAARLESCQSKPADGVSATPLRISGEKQKGGEKMFDTRAHIRFGMGGQESPRVKDFWPRIHALVEQLLDLKVQLGDWEYDRKTWRLNKDEFHIYLQECPVCCTVGEGGTVGEFMLLTQQIREWLGVKTLVFHYSRRYEGSDLDIKSLNRDSILLCKHLPICEGVRWVKD